MFDCLLITSPSLKIEKYAKKARMKIKNCAPKRLNILKIWVYLYTL